MNVLKRYSGIGGGIQSPDRLIIHSMSEIINGMHASEFLESVGLSAHFLILPDGKIMKLRKTHEKAWHAKGNNTNTVGIEVLIGGEHTYDSFVEAIKEDWVKPEQMDALIELSKGIIEYYEIPVKSVLRHSDISPERKVDPGSGFDWEYFKSKLI